MHHLQFFVFVSRDADELHKSPVRPYKSCNFQDPLLRNFRNRCICDEHNTLSNSRHQSSCCCNRQKAAQHSTQLCLFENVFFLLNPRKTTTTNTTRRNKQQRKRKKKKTSSRHGQREGTRDGVHEVYRLRIVVREYECQSARENSVEMSLEWGSGAEICLKMCGRKQGRRCCQEE
jgi:hypothetical protein